MSGHESKVAGRLAVLVLLATVVLLWASASPPLETRKLFGLWNTKWAFLGALGLCVALVLALRTISRDAAVSALFTLGLVAVVWAGLEGIGQLGLVSYADIFGGASTEAPIGTVVAPKIHVSGETFMDTATGWGLESKPIAFDYATNQLGFRNRPDAEAADIYLVGDSILVSALTKFEDTVTAQTAERTGRTTMTIALIGISPLREQTLFRTAKVPLDGRLVLQFIFEGNDLRDTAEERAVQEGGTPPPSFKSRSLSQQVVLILQRLTQPVVASAKRRMCTIDGQGYTFFWARESFEGYVDQMATIEANIRTFRDEIEAAGGRYGIVFVPSKLRVLAGACTFPPGTDFAPVEAHLSPMRAMIQKFATVENIALLDVTDALIEQADRRPVPWFWGDTHPNAEGHRVMAERIAAWHFVQTATIASP